MKSKWIALFLYFAVASGAAPSVRHSVPTNGIYAEIMLDRGLSLSADKAVAYGFLRTTNSSPILALFPRACHGLLAKRELSMRVRKASQ